MEQELESLNQQMQAEIKQIRDKYNSLKKECRARHKPKTAKKKRSVIPKALKNEVWDNSIGREKGVGNCYCCNKEIDSKHFECGHIIAVSNGGTNTLPNLKPVCSLCNKSMGSKNMEEFKQNYMSHIVNQKGVKKNSYQLNANGSTILPGTQHHSFYKPQTTSYGQISLGTNRSWDILQNRDIKEDNGPVSLGMFQIRGEKEANDYMNNFFNIK